ncbi:XRE family transcriptional regulator [Campylobacter sp. RM9328]|uniref:XRE family transcriptional regulator n=1 Tax=Campylobacter sp. RM9328 TaxID=1705720 RepID=UPI001474FDCB|nr:XRE family transcriptional regulator [Campylobacter sp. RM9328]
MDRQEFNELLKKANLSKKEFAEIVGLQYGSVNNWGGSQDVPRWVKSWLENYDKSTRYEKIKEITKEI